MPSPRVRVAGLALALTLLLAGGGEVWAEARDVTLQLAGILCSG
jgi:hypothetical protein